MDCSPLGFSVYGDSLGKNTGVGYHRLLQGIFTTQGLNPGLLHCRESLYRLNHQGGPSAHEVDHYYWPLQLHVFVFVCVCVMLENENVPNSTVSCEIYPSSVHIKSSPNQ